MELLNKRYSEYFMGETGGCRSTGLEVTLLSFDGPIVCSGSCSTSRSAPPGLGLFLGAFVINTNTSDSNNFPCSSANRLYVFFRV